MISKKPSVSVIMPVYNAGSFVSDSIESILGQTYKNFELIIVNDASTDDSLKIIYSYKRRFPKKVRVINLKKNLNRGGDVCANLGFAKAKGKFIARMDADDIAVSTRLEKQVNFLLKHPKYALIGSNAFVIDGKGEITGEKMVPSLHKDILKEFFVFNPLIHPTVMIRKSALNERKELYEIKYDANNDYFTFIKLITSGLKFANLKQKLIYYRVHGKNDSLNFVKSRFLNSLKIRAKAVFEFSYKPTFKSVIKLFGQVVIVLLLPEKAILSIYLVVRGIKKISDFLPFPSKPLFVRLKKAFIPSL
ncbi:MAG: glycosyltransferase [Patescibacteria group bacterium]